MAGKLSVQVKPAGDANAAGAKQVLFARLTYTREVAPDDDSGGAAAPVRIPGSRRAELAAGGDAKIEVADVAGGSEWAVQVESIQGTVLWTSPTKAIGGDGLGGEAEVPAAVYTVVPRDPGAAPSLTRAGRFVRLDDQLPDFTGYRMFIAAIRPTEVDGGANPQTAAVRELLDLGDGGEVTSFEVTQLDTNTARPATLNSLYLQEATLRPDGAFDFAVDIAGDEIAWLWLLLGPEDFAGYQLDALPLRQRPPTTLMLPGNPDAPAQQAGTLHTSLDFDEQQLIDHPDLFADDPGTSCSPFGSPHRILGERPFSTVLRTDQPEIGGQASLVVSRPLLPDLAPPIRLSRVETPDLTALNAARGRLTEFADARVDVRKSLDLAIFRPSRRPWVQWVKEHTRDRAPVSADNPIEWEGDPSIYQAVSVAGGHILEWRVQWRSNGYSLGDVAHSLTLAPRQTRRVARITWRRREEARRTEETVATDALTQVTARSRDYTDAVQSSLSEWSSGGSKSRTRGSAGGIGFAAGPVVMGGGSAHGAASSESWQQGGRRVAAAEQQQLRDAIRQFGESLRRQENTIVSEITQEEEVEGVTETLRNVNYCHALTVVYYEILRHLRVDTSFGGVRECLFVPFAITPFDLDKTLKWRDKLRHGMLDRSLTWALDRLDEVVTAWADSDIPPGPRMSHPVTYVSGSLYIRLSVERPREQGEDETLEDYLRLWTRHSAILVTPARTIIANLRAAAERARDAYFQREVAPGMAARWADNLRLEFDGGGAVDGADFTVATTYRFGSVVRVDFTAPIEGNLTRQRMQRIVIRAGRALPEGSVANLQRLTLHYYTNHYDRITQSDTAARDLVTVETGQPEAAGATLPLPVTAWEREDLRRVIENGVEALLVHLNANLVYYTKVIMWLYDRDELYMLIDGFTAPYSRRFSNGQWVEDPGRSLASVVERDPIAILGNSLVFRVAAGAFLGINGHDSPEAAYRYYAGSQVRSEPLRVSLPTDGLYAQALMDPCNACEEHFGSVDWVLGEADLEPEAIAGQLGSRRAEPEGQTPTPLPSPIIALQNAQAAPDPQGLAGVLGAVANANAFRDMAGLAGTQANAAAAMTTAAGLASGFGNQAAALEMERRKQAAAELDKQRASLERSVDAGFLTKENAAGHLNKLHDLAAGGTPQESTRTTDELLTNVAAGLQPGQSGTVSRTTPTGAETVSVDGSLLAKPDSSRPFIIEVSASPALRAFNPSHDITGVTRLSVRSTRLPAGTPLRWSIPATQPATQTGKYTITQTQSVAGVSEVVITGVRPGLTAIDVDAIDGSAPGTNESLKFPLSIPQFIAIDDQNAQLDAFMTANNFTAVQEAILAEARAVTEQIVLGQANVRLIWKSTGATVPATVPASMVTRMTIGNTNPSGGGYGRSAAGPSAAGVGDTAFDEVLDVYPASFVAPAPAAPQPSVNAATNELAQILTSLQASDPVVESWIIRVFGRLIGETAAHEIFHSLLPVPFEHNVDASGNAIDTGDIMDQASERSFLERTGITAMSTAPGDFINNLTDNGRAAINGLVNATHLASLRKTFPIPPTPPFDR